MNLIVTGAAGYLGSTLTLRLSSLGHHVIAVDNDEDGLRRLSRLRFSKGSIEFVRLNLNEFARAADLLSRRDALIHLAGVSSDRAADGDPELAWRINVDSALELARGAKAAGIPRFLQASTAAIYQVPVGHRLADELLCDGDQPSLDTPIGVYAQSKFAAEQQLVRMATKRFAVMLVRQGSLYGYSPIMRWDLIINHMVLSAWLEDPVVLHDYGAVWRPIVHVEDAACAFVHLLSVPCPSHGSLRFNVVERNVRLSEVCLELNSITRGELGRGIVLHHGSAPFPQRTGRVSGESLRNVGWLPARNLRDGVCELLQRLRDREIALPDGSPAIVTTVPRRSFSQQHSESGDARALT